jgi:hypothetical protein
MGVPESYFDFLKLPFWYDPRDYNQTGDSVKINYYSNGQPMGLYISFPMFELAHYVILKFATATVKADFCICGDDVVVACDTKEEGDEVFSRYKSLVHRFGGIISLSKTISSSRLAEGVGALFLKGIPKEIRIPSGKLSTLEAFTPGTWLYQEIVHRSAIGRAILSAWLSTKLEKRYTYDQRRSMNESMVTENRWSWSLEALRSLDKRDRMPQTYYAWEEEDFDFWRNTPEGSEDLVSPFKWIGPAAFAEALVSNKIVSLYLYENKIKRKQLCPLPKFRGQRHLPNPRSRR